MRAEGSGQVIAEIQVVPSPSGTHTSRWAHVDAAIAAVAECELNFEVGPLGTSIEGPAEAVWAVLRRAHEATLTDGADGVVTVIKLYETRDPAAQASMDDLTAAHRPAGETR
jgi:uncharacterized protein YqgV (UPF0045/DUF77 family)